MTELIRILAPDEQAHRHVVCCWWSRESPSCVRLPVLRVATPHGTMDYCAEHVDYAVASLPREWLNGFEYREPVISDHGDDIPF